MNNLNDEELDKYIKEKFQKDTVISNKADSVFKNFNPKTEKHSKENTNIQYETKATNKDVMNALFYKRLNRFLSVAAVTLTVVLVGGTAFYFNKDSNNNTDNPNETNNQSIIYNQKYLIKNEPLQIVKEQVMKTSENGYVMAYLLGKRDVGINLTSTYWNEFDGEFKTTDCYKIDNVDEDVSDILVGRIGLGLPYVLLLMEDGTIEYVDLNCLNGNVFHFVAKKLEGLDNVVGFEQKSRKFSYSNTEYYYVNAIRKDGLRKEIEIGVINDWYDNVIEDFNKYNRKYIEAYNKTSIPDDGKGDFTVNNITYLSVNGENKYVYCFKDSKFYRVERSNAKEECIVSGCGGFVRNNPDGRITVSLTDNYKIYSLDKNLVYRDRNNNVITEVNAKINNQNQVSYSVFSKYKGITFKNEDFNTTADRAKEYCVLSFDKEGKPTIKIGYKSDANTECYFETSEITNLQADVAAGTTYVTIDFKAWTPGGDATGNATISYGNVVDDYNLTVSAKVNFNPGVKEYKNITVKPQGQNAIENFTLPEFKNRVYESEKKENNCWYKVEFDGNGNMIITEFDLLDGASQIVGTYRRFTDVTSDAAAGTAYITFSYRLLNETGAKVEGRLRYSNNTDNNEIGLIMNGMEKEMTLKRVK